MPYPSPADETSIVPVLILLAIVAYIIATIVAAIADLFI